MKRLIALALVVMFAVIGCGSTRPTIQIQGDAAQAVANFSAAAIGYYGYQHYPQQFGAALEVAEILLEENGPLQGVVNAVVNELTGVMAQDQFLAKRGRRLLEDLKIEVVDGSITVGDNSEVIQNALIEFMGGIRDAQSQEV